MLFRSVPLLYTDSINGQQVCRDDLWLCATAAFAVPPAAEPVAWRYQTPTGWHATTDPSAAMRVSAHHPVEPLYTAPPAPTEQWMPIETAPKDGTRILLYFPPQHPSWTRTIEGGFYEKDRFAKKPRPYWTGDGERVYGVLHYRTNQPTHYQPIPAPPQGEANGG